MPDFNCAEPAFGSLRSGRSSVIKIFDDEADPTGSERRMPSKVRSRRYEKRVHHTAVTHVNLDISRAACRYLPWSSFLLAGTSQRYCRQLLQVSFNAGLDPSRDHRLNPYLHRHEVSS